MRPALGPAHGPQPRAREPRAALGASRQGDWGYFLDYGQTPRYSPYTPITGLTGYDSTSQTVNGQRGARWRSRPSAKPSAAGVDKWVTQRWDVRLSARQEQKEPAAACSAAAAAPPS